MTRSRRADRGQLEQKLLILVTLVLVAYRFGARVGLEASNNT